ncbi:NAD-dependent epimerase/dehydratase family protein [Lactobacillus agilis]|uniref:NAD-dependent epimerase/dehydratase family protein n=1 Tax=Ligilactobacillus agilis TaxID=1601 RepID=A0A848C783_9LACO|nr:NAD-dependent epimerase/dehydratase family protein [Ligilactobacillus agilis]NME42591.1 NAD-dependent epimerase/dehydratase family protein [Ligilactobacillus agilis]
MRVALIGGAGFIGTNLAIHLSKNEDVTIVDRSEKYFSTMKSLDLPVKYLVAPFELDANFDEQVKNQDIVYHLASTVIPGNSNNNIANELEANIIVTCKLLDACVRQGVKKVVFISSGGAVYGKQGECPIDEDTLSYPISSYGIEKITIEKLLYLYRYIHGLDYRVVRLANPYGPYQRPNGKLGVVTTFVYEMLNDRKLQVYGDGNVVRDFIYIEDAVKAIDKVVQGESNYKTFNIGSGMGVSVNNLIAVIEHTLKKTAKVEYIHGRSADVPVNYLDINRYESIYGRLVETPLKEGIKKTADFMRDFEL